MNGGIHTEHVGFSRTRRAKRSEVSVVWRMQTELGRQAVDYIVFPLPRGPADLPDFNRTLAWMSGSLSIRLSIGRSACRAAVPGNWRSI